jgi:hypothetical protein
MRWGRVKGDQLAREEPSSSQGQIPMTTPSAVLRFRLVGRNEPALGFEWRKQRELTLVAHSPGSVWFGDLMRNARRRKPAK